MSDMKSRLGDVDMCTLDNAAGSQDTARKILGCKYALRSVFHIIMLLVESCAPSHILRPLLAAALSHTFFQLDPWDMNRLRERCAKKGIPVTAKVVKEARRRGKVR